MCLIGGLLFSGGLKFTLCQANVDLAIFSDRILLRPIFCIHEKDSDNAIE